MPARIVIVLNEPGFADQVAAALQAEGQDAIGLTDPMVALDALEASRRIEVLVTGTNFGQGKLHGLALGRIAGLKQPGVRILFVGPADVEEYAHGIGDFMPSPATVPQVVEGVMLLLDKRSTRSPDRALAHGKFS